MKLTTAPRTHVTNLTGESKQFSIAVNGKAFRVLLDGLYTNKIRAVVRELWTNAFDSHIAAGMEGVPFDTHLPTRMDPTFRVRDYGVSLTHEQVMGLYTTLFESTKESTNDEVGMLGLGSKSPFAYSDTFSVIARLDGRRRTYLAAIGADGTPTITLVDDVEADEAQGLEIVIPSRAEDHHSFAEEARSLAIGFDPLPVVDGVEIDIPDPVYVADNGRFAVFDNHYMFGDSRLAVRQGCVIYPVDDHNLVSPIGSIVNWGYSVIIDVPIGAVNITASREGLSLDDETRQTVIDHVREFASFINEELQQKIDEQPNLLAAIRYWTDNQGDMRRVFQFSPKYRGDPLNNFIPLKGGADWETPMVRDGNRKAPHKLKHLDYATAKQVKFVVRRTGQDVKREMMRYREFVNNHNGKVYLLTDPTPRLLERLFTLLGLRREQIVNIATLPDPGPAKRNGGGGSSKGVKGVYRAEGGYYRNVEEFDPNVPYYWVQVARASRDESIAATSYGQDIVTYGGAKRPVYMFTEGAVKRYKPNAKDNASTVRVAMGKKFAQKVVDKYEESVFIGSFGYDAREALGLSHQDALTSTEMQAIRLWADPDEVAAADAAAKQRADEYRLRYPLVFDRYSRGALNAYVALVDECEALRKQVADLT